MSYKENEPVIEKLKKLLVRVQTLDERQETLKSGTGFFLDSTHIVTANHVVSEASDPECTLKILYPSGWGDVAYNAEIIHSNPKYDVNILRVLNGKKCNEVEYVKFIPQSYKEREFSYASYGYPSSKPEGHYQNGIILDEFYGPVNQKFVDISLGDGRLNDYSGYSGSPVVCNGQLIGIAVEQSVGLNAAQSIKVLDTTTFVELLSADWIDDDSFIREILEVFRNESIKEVRSNKANGKYIPEIFVELGDMKEYLRGFSDPVLFFKKHLDYVKRHRFEQYNKLLDRYGIRNIGVTDSEKVMTINNIDEISSMMVEQLKDMLTYVSKLTNNRRIRDSVPEEYLELFDMSYFEHRFLGLKWEVEDRIRLFESLCSSQLLLIEKAGQGKTNLLCDFTENILLRKDIPCIFLSTRNLINNDLKETMLSNFGKIDKIENLFKVLDYISERVQLPFVIVLDAINEQREVLSAKKTMYDFLNKVNELNHIRVLMTARTEYFEEKFGDIREECPQVQLFESYNWRSQNGKLKERVFDGYMEHFHIHIDDISDSIYDQLSTDFLLLRMFSESHQGTSERSTFIPALLHLFRYEIFERYYKYKKENLKEWDRLHGKIDSGSVYDNLIDSTTEYMINNMKFSNIERSVIVGEVQNELLVKLIDEDIIFREDILKQQGLIESEVEVINFTFDEFRDFCIAKKMMERFDGSSIDEYSKSIEQLTNPKSEASEGIQKYLFFASKKFKIEAFTQIIVSQKWFYKIYFENIFSVSEEYLEEQDLKFITRVLTDIKFYEDNNYIVLKFYKNLIRRFNTSVYKILNIRLLVIILEHFSDEDFRYYVHDIFEPSYEERYFFDRKDRIHIDKLVLKLKNHFVRSFSIDILIFLGYLDMRGLYIYEFFNWCMEKHPYEIIDMLELLLSSKDELEINIVKHIVRDLSYYKFEIDGELLLRWSLIKNKCKEPESISDDAFGFSGFSYSKLKEMIKKLEEGTWEEDE